MQDTDQKMSLLMRVAVADRADLIRLVWAGHDLAIALQLIVSEMVDHAERNNLGDPEKQNLVISARRALAEWQGARS